MPFTTIQESGTKVIGDTTLIPQVLHPDVMAASALASSLGNPFTRLQIDYINAFVNGQVAAGLWSLHKAVYLFVGGSANQHMINFKDARNADPAYRLSFLGGGWTHDATGSTPNGTSSYANTFFPSNSFSSDINARITMYSGTNSQSGYDIGSTSAPGGAGNSCGLIVKYIFGGGATYASFGGAIGNQISNSEGRGFFLGNKLGANITEIWWARAGETFVSQRTTFSQTFVRNAVNIYLAQNNPLIAGVYGGKRFQYVDFGDGLTAQQIQTHRNLVQALQQSLSRAV